MSNEHDTNNHEFVSDDDMNKEERRKSKRFESPIDVEIRTLTQNPIYDSVMSRDISRGGISFDSKQPIEEGTSVELKLNVPGDNLPVFASGTVAWADGIQTGIKLTKIAKLDESRILEYIYNEWLRHKKEDADTPHAPEKG